MNEQKKQMKNDQINITVNKKQDNDPSKILNKVLWQSYSVTHQYKWFVFCKHKADFYKS